MTLTAELRQELSWAKNAKLIRQGVYDVGILLGAILLADQIDIIAKLWPWPEHPTEEQTLHVVAFLFALALWVGMVFNRYADWNAIAAIEKGFRPRRGRAGNRADVEQGRVEESGAGLNG